MATDNRKIFRRRAWANGKWRKRPKESKEESHYFRPVTFRANFYTIKIHTNKIRRKMAFLCLRLEFYQGKLPGY